MKLTQVLAKSSLSEPWIQKKTIANELFETMETKNVILIIFCLQLMMWELQTCSEETTFGGVGSSSFVVESESEFQSISSSSKEIVGLQSELHIMFYKMMCLMNRKAFRKFLS